MHDLFGIQWDNVLDLSDIESETKFVTNSFNCLFDKHCSYQTA